MKLKSIILAAATAILAFTACSEGTNEYHSTYFYPTGATSLTTYADQTYDSIRVVSYDSWTLNNQCDWFDVKLSSQVNNIAVNVPSGYVNGSLLELTIQPNTTGKTRSAALQVVSSFNKIGTLQMMVSQKHYLNVSHPAVKTDTNGNTTFGIALSSSAKKDDGSYSSFVTFTVYSADATLTSSDSWLVPEKTTGFDTSKTQKVTFTAEPNTTGAARTATLTLTSAGISTTISVTEPA